MTTHADATRVATRIVALVRQHARAYFVEDRRIAWDADPERYNATILRFGEVAARAWGDCPLMGFGGSERLRIKFIERCLASARRQT